MRELPDYTGIVVAPNDPVAPESLNLPSRYSEAFRDVYAREHRVDDFEHSAPLAPQAVAYCRWVGSSYELTVSHNVESVIANGTGDVVITLSVASATREDWFPIVAIQRVDGDKPAIWWEYDDGTTRDVDRCRLRFCAVVGGDTTDTMPDFVFWAYMRQRVGDGDSTPEAVRDVRQRIAVDGVESAGHRQKLIDFCVSHRARWIKGHDKDARHFPPQYPLAAFQVAKTEGRSNLGEVLWQHGPLASLAWRGEAVDSQDDPYVAWQVAQYKRWRSALLSWRIASADPYTKDFAPWVRRISRADDYGSWARGGGIGAQIDSAAGWAAVTGIGVVLTGML